MFVEAELEYSLPIDIYKDIDTGADRISPIIFSWYKSSTETNIGDIIDDYLETSYNSSPKPQGNNKRGRPPVEKDSSISKLRELVLKHRNNLSIISARNQRSDSERTS